MLKTFPLKVKSCYLMRYICSAEIRVMNNQKEIPSSVGIGLDNSILQRSSGDGIFLCMTPLEVLEHAKSIDILGAEPGVYFILIGHFPEMTKNRIVYICSSKNMRKRIDSPNHPYSVIMKRLKPFHLICFKLFYPCDNYLQVEKECIKYFKPKFNKAHKCP